MTTAPKPKTAAQIHHEASAVARKVADASLEKYLLAGEDEALAEAWAMEDAGDALDAYLAKHNL